MPLKPAQIGRRRRPASGGYARGDETRAQIVRAALQVFGEEGYVRASTRHIAHAAGVTPPALQYYFDGKEGLHLACAELLIDGSMSLLAPAMAAAETALQSAPAHALDALCDVLDALLDASLSAKKLEDRARFFARVQAEQAGPAYPLIRTRVILPLQELCAALVAAVLGRASIDAEIRLRTAMVMSQISAIHVHGGSTLSALDWADFDGERRDQVKALLRSQTRGALVGLSQ